MLSFKEFITEGVFAVHNAHVLHKALVKHVEDNIGTVSSKFHHGQPYEINAQDIDRKFRNVNLRLTARKAKYHGDSILSGEFSPKIDDPHKSTITLHMGFNPDQDVAHPEHIKTQLNNVNHRAAFVHEYTHFDDHTRRLNKEGPLAARMAHFNNYLAGKQIVQHNNPEPYFNNDDEVRAFHRQIAYTRREKMKAGDSSPIHRSERDFINYAHPHNVLPIRNYIRRIEGNK